MMCVICFQGSSLSEDTESTGTSSDTESQQDDTVTQHSTSEEVSTCVYHIMHYVYIATDQ